VWLFDPDMSEEVPAGVVRARWSPIASVNDWDSALLMGKAVMESASRAARGENGDSKGDDKHFSGRATDWLQCLLYAAHLRGVGMSVVADWASSATDKTTIDEVAGTLGRAKDAGDQGAKIAWSKLSGLLQTPEKERGSIISTMIGSLRVYDSVKAREVAESPNFDPARFVRSKDTLYITSRPDRQAAFGPLIGALLEQIRYATYDRHKRVLGGREVTQPHVTFVLDEAANTAPVPLDRMVSEAGGQGLHLVVGLQSITQAYERWGDGGKGFLTLFPMKVVLPGTFDEDTTKALSSAAGKYDRQVTTHSVSTSYVGRYLTPMASPSTSYQVQREDVLTQGDITAIPAGKALVWDGPDWGLLDTGFSFQAPYWRELTQWGESAEIPLLAIEK
ncbi:type IV secretory system conjugative DNA transfer family protein, partial [Glutamicibacter arilaitensis]|uniref:type IV secretory system conjugative DNA transfer family protein n=1 Tax=Glutamicibacter arilaitensis TaxID=256701 RepID=UPI003FD2E1AE